MRFSGRRFYCNVCSKTITEREYNYSMDKFKKALCRFHQNRIPSAKNYDNYSKSPNDKSTPEARKLYFALKKRGIPARLEQYDGHKHIDIAIPAAKLNIEIDGLQHSLSVKQASSDLKRTMYSMKKGFDTVHIPNSMITKNFEQTLENVIKIFRNRNKQMEENGEYEDDDEDDDWF